MKSRSIWGARAYEDQLRKLHVLRREIKKGLRDVERGRLISPERAFAAVDKVLGKKRPKARDSATKLGDSSHRLIEVRSLAMHVVIAAKVQLNPTLLEVPRRNLKRWRAAAADDLPGWLEEWNGIVKRPWPEIAAIITEPSEEGARLRQFSPFAGILSQTERRRIYDAFRLDRDPSRQRKWRRENAEAIRAYNDRVAKSGTFSIPKE